MKYFFPVILFLLSLFSCTERIDIPTRDAPPIPVVYGCLTDAYGRQAIRLTSSSPYFEKAVNKDITNASVVVRSSVKEYRFEYGENGYYISTENFACVAGETYKLEIKVDFDRDGTPETYQAQTVTPLAVSLDSISLSPQNLMGFGHYGLRINMQDPPEIENYYLFRYYLRDTITNDDLTQYILSEDRMFNGVYLKNININFFEDGTDENVLKMIEESKNSDYLYYQRLDNLLYPGDTVRLEIMNIEKDYFRFINDCRSEKRGENPLFGGPPSNIITNISNGAAGFFTSHCIRTKSTAVPEKE
ncbi:MAG: DUF4249 domain-containing protein [Tannerella sp.]|jgi:hypothetical protein|nr:DUF4249 domain-containing protein [Tannerella sp.]